MLCFAEPLNLGSSTNVLFINASQNRDANTAKMAKKLLRNTAYEKIDLVDFKIYALGQNYSDDELAKLMDIIKKTDLIVVGTPIYWHSVAGSLKNFIDRSSQDESAKEILKGKRLYFFAQGTAPSQILKDSIKYMITRYADVMGLKLEGLMI